MIFPKRNVTRSRIFWRQPASMVWLTVWVVWAEQHPFHLATSICVTSQSFAIYNDNSNSTTDLRRLTMASNYQQRESMTGFGTPILDVVECYYYCWCCFAVDQQRREMVHETDGERIAQLKARNEWVGLMMRFLFCYKNVRFQNAASCTPKFLFHRGDGVRIAERQWECPEKGQGERRTGHTEKGEQLVSEWRWRRYQVYIYLWEFRWGIDSRLHFDRTRTTETKDSSVRRRHDGNSTVFFIFSTIALHLVFICQYPILYLYYWNDLHITMLSCVHRVVFLFVVITWCFFLTWQFRFK